MEKEIAEIFREWGKKLAEDLKVSADRALKEGGRKNPNAIKLDFDLILESKGNVSVSIIAVNGKTKVKYWNNVETGRKAGAKRLPADVVGKKWQNENKIDPRKVLTDMRAKKGLKIPKKALNYDKAAKTLSFIYQNLIFKKGIKPKPFVDRIITDSRIAELKNALFPIIKQEFELNFYSTI